MSEQSRATFRSATSRWIVTLNMLGVAMLILFRIAVQAKAVPEIVWFLKLVLIQLVVYFGVAWLSLRTSSFSNV